MKLTDLFESANETVPVLYHGTCEENATALCKNGWQPNKVGIGGNFGQTKYLYLTTGYEDALWFANQKGCSSIVRVKNIPLEYLQVDPEDGISDTVEDELHSLHNLPGKVILTHPLSPEHFELCKLNEDADTSLSKEAVEQWASKVQRELGLKSFSVYLRNDGAIKLAMIGVSEKKKGTGTKAMEALCAFADSHHRRVLLTPAVKDPNWGTTSQSRLIAFYKRFGFKLNKGRHTDYSINDLMYRDPQDLNEEVWHGTKHDFDQFSIAHTGTGEGNFTFGWGLYFTDKREIAEWYRDRLSNNTLGREVEVIITPPPYYNWGSEPIKFSYYDNNLENFIQVGIEAKAPFEHDGNKADFASYHNAKIDMVASKENYNFFLKEVVRSLAKEILTAIEPKISRYISEGPQAWARKCYDSIKKDLLYHDDEEEDRIKVKKMILAGMECVKTIRYPDVKGAVYKVNIPDDTKYLLWDSPLNIQPEPIKKIILGLMKNHFFRHRVSMSNAGAYLYDTVVYSFTKETDLTENEAKKKASLYLHHLGMAGIKYFTGDTRQDNKKVPHYNYVLFTDNNIEILHKE